LTNQKQELPVAAIFVNESGRLAIYIEDIPRKLPAKFWFILESGFRGENYQEIGQPETRIACDDHVR
jgi:hypothetical protein